MAAAGSNSLLLRSTEVNGFNSLKHYTCVCLFTHQLKQRLYRYQRVLSFHLKADVLSPLDRFKTC